MKKSIGSFTTFFFIQSCFLINQNHKPSILSQTKNKSQILQEAAVVYLQNNGADSNQMSEIESMALQLANASPAELSQVVKEFNSADLINLIQQDPKVAETFANYKPNSVELISGTLLLALVGLINITDNLQAQKSRTSIPNANLNLNDSSLTHTTLKAIIILNLYENLVAINNLVPDTDFEALQSKIKEADIFNSDNDQIIRIQTEVNLAYNLAKISYLSELSLATINGSRIEFTQQERFFLEEMKNWFLIFKKNPGSKAIPHLQNLTNMMKTLPSFSDLAIEHQLAGINYTEAKSLAQKLDILNKGIAHDDPEKIKTLQEFLINHYKNLSMLSQNLKKLIDTSSEDQIEEIMIVEGQIGTMMTHWSKQIGDQSLIVVSGIEKEFLIASWSSFLALSKVLTNMKHPISTEGKELLDNFINVVNAAHLDFLKNAKLFPVFTRDDSLLRKAEPKLFETNRVVVPIAEAVSLQTELVAPKGEILTPSRKRNLSSIFGQVKLWEVGTRYNELLYGLAGTLRNLPIFALDGNPTEITIQLRAEPTLVFLFKIADFISKETLEGVK